MTILSLESSCDETAAAIVADGRVVLSNIVASQVEAHRVYGGVVPEIASRMHVEAISGVTDEALRCAELTFDDIDAFAVTYAPGLIGALLVGLNFAKGLAFAAGKPLIPVHHLRGHVAANYLTHKDLEPPFLCLIVSGGHTHIVEVADYTTFRVIGRTRDDAAGEALDKTARAMGLPYPGGMHLDTLGRDGDPKAYAFPRPKVTRPDGTIAPYDFSFSGLKTAAIVKLKELSLLDDHAGGGRQSAAPTCEDLCRGGTLPPTHNHFAASYQYAVADYLCQNTLRAARDYGYRTLALAGGVCANSCLRAEMRRRCEAEGIALYMPALAFCGDNAAMIGAQGYYEWRAGHIAGLELNALATLGVDSGYFSA